MGGVASVRGDGDEVLVRVSDDEVIRVCIKTDEGADRVWKGDKARPCNTQLLHGG